MFISSPDKLLVRQTELCNQLGMTRSGLHKIRKRDPSFPLPIKDGAHRQAATYFVVSEVEAWLSSRIAARDSAAK